MINYNLLKYNFQLFSEGYPFLHKVITSNKRILTLFCIAMDTLRIRRVWPHEIINDICRLHLWYGYYSIKSSRLSKIKDCQCQKCTLI